MDAIDLGPISVDVGAARVMRHGVDLHLRPRAFQAFRVLLLHRGEYVSYERMIAEAWEGVHVSKHTVDVTVAEVKKRLGECGRWITHRRKIGYRLELPRRDELVREGQHFERRSTREGFEKAITCFERSIAEDSGHVEAFQAISHCYLMLAVHGMRPPREMYDRFLKAHGQAEALAGRTLELRCDRAHTLHLFERRIKEAEAELLGVLEEAPTFRQALFCLALLRVTTEQLDAALEALGRLRELDPLFPSLDGIESFVHLCRRDQAAAVKASERAVELYPYLPLSRTFHAQALLDAGRSQEALTQVRFARAHAPDLPWLLPLEGAYLAWAGRPREARAVVGEVTERRKLDYVDAYFVAVLLEAVGLRDEAFSELSRAIEENSCGVYTMTVDPKMDPFRNDPRFTQLYRKAFP